MVKLMLAILISLIAGVGGTGLGGLFVIIFKRPKEVFFSALIGLAGGVMLGIVFFHLIPEGIDIGNKSLMFNGFLGGVLIFLLLDRIISHLHISGIENAETSKILKIKKMGLLIAIGIALHNFPEGLAIGSGFSAESAFGIGIAILIGLHNFPEGIALAAPIYAGGASKLSTFIKTCFTGLPMVIGAIVGFLVGETSKQAISICLGFAAGAMFFITCDELIPECHMEAEKYGHVPILSIIVGLVVSFII